MDNELNALKRTESETCDLRQQVRVKRLVSVLRDWIELTPDQASDEEILKNLKGSFLMEKAKCKIAMDDLCLAVKKSVEEDAEKIRNAISGLSKFRR